MDKENPNEQKARVNYSEQERIRLKHLLQNYKVIWRKETDAGTNEEKKKAWVDIQKEYNNSPGCHPRTIRQLQKLWNNIKFKHRQEITKGKKGRMKTGGGVPNSTYESDPLLEIMKYTPDIEIKNVCDSDYWYMSKNSKASNEHQSIQACSLKDDNMDYDLDENVCSDDYSDGPNQSSSKQICSNVTSLGMNASCSSEIGDGSQLPRMNVPSTSGIGGGSQLSSLNMPESSEDSDDEHDPIHADLCVEEELSMCDESILSAPPRRRRRKQKFIFEALLMHQRRKIDRMEKLQMEIHALKVQLMKAKIRAAEAKEMYYRNKKCNE